MVPAISPSRIVTRGNLERVVAGRADPTDDSESRICAECRAGNAANVRDGRFVCSGPGSSGRSVTICRSGHFTEQCVHRMPYDQQAGTLGVDIEPTPPPGTASGVSVVTKSVIVVGDYYAAFPSWHR